MRKIVIFLIIGIIALSNDLNAQISSSELNEIKERLKIEHPNWKYCNVDGMVKSRTFTDSINQYYINVPSDYDLTIYETEKHSVSQFHASKVKTNGSSIIEIKFVKAINHDLEDFFNKELIKSIQNKSLISLGTDNFDGKTVFWNELSFHNTTNNGTRNLNFYLLNPESRRVVILTIKSFRKKKHGIDFCLMNQFIRHFEWLK